MSDLKKVKLTLFRVDIFFRKIFVQKQVTMFAERVNKFSDEQISQVSLFNNATKIYYIMILTQD